LKLQKSVTEFCDSVIRRSFFSVRPEFDAGQLQSDWGSSAKAAIELEAIEGPPSGPITSF